MQMPAAVINVAHYNQLKERLEVVGKGENYCCLRASVAYDEDEYTEWASELRG